MFKENIENGKRKDFDQIDCDRVVKKGKRGLNLLHTSGNGNYWSFTNNNN